MIKISLPIAKFRSWTAINLLGPAAMLAITAGCAVGGEEVPEVMGDAREGEHCYTAQDCAHPLECISGVCVRPNPGDTGGAPSGGDDAYLDCPGITTAACGGQCRDLLTDPEHCGDCFNACTPGGSCQEGRCTVPVTDVSIAAEQKDLTMAAGDSATLDVNVSPPDADDPSVRWSTSDGAVASVDSRGLVEANGAGSAVITVQSPDGLHSDSARVTVIIPASSITIEPEFIALNRGQSGQLVATVTPAYATHTALEWRSNSPAVATVDQNGRVTAADAGEAIVEVTAPLSSAIAFAVVTVRGSWTDPNTSLSWLDPPHDGLSWSDAQGYCQNLEMNNMRDWRLPTIAELRSIIQGCPATATGGECNADHGGCTLWSCRSEACDGCEEGMGPSGNCYRRQGLTGLCEWHWSSTHHPDSSWTWGVDFISANVHFGERDQETSFRCVRGFFNN